MTGAPPGGQVAGWPGGQVGGWPGAVAAPSLNDGTGVALRWRMPRLVEEATGRRGSTRAYAHRPR